MRPFMPMWDVWFPNALGLIFVKRRGPSLPLDVLTLSPDRIGLPGLIRVAFTGWRVHGAVGTCCGRAV